MENIFEIKAVSYVYIILIYLHIFLLYGLNLWFKIKNNAFVELS